MSQFLRNRAVIQLIRTTSCRSCSVTETLHHQHHRIHLITPREHRQHHSRNIHTTAYLRGAITARGPSHRHLPSSAGGHWESQHHPTPATPTRSITTTNTTIISTPSTRTMATSTTSTTAGSPKENRNPALPSSTPPSPRSAQEGQDATPCPAANESRPQPDNTAQEHQQPEDMEGQQPAQSQSQSHPQALPAPPPKESDSAAAGDTTRLEVGGEGVRLDHLGPLVVHQDGTVSRISNWAEMTDIERKNTLRILGKRNQLRLDTLRGKAGDDSTKES